MNQFQCNFIDNNQNNQDNHQNNISTSHHKLKRKSIKECCRHQYQYHHDNDLTNLNWLQDFNLVKKFYAQQQDSMKQREHQCNDNDNNRQLKKTCDLDRKLQNPKLKKPPYSYSMLIFMAIESSPTRSMMVRDIYRWIIDHYPFFANASSGWKNTIRHTLSLRKCFKKKINNSNILNNDNNNNSDTINDQDLKGGYWYVVPEYRQSILLQQQKQLRSKQNKNKIFMKEKIVRKNLKQKIQSKNKSKTATTTASAMTTIMTMAATTTTASITMANTSPSIIINQNQSFENGRDQKHSIQLSNLSTTTNNNHQFHATKTINNVNDLTTETVTVNAQKMDININTNNLNKNNLNLIKMNSNYLVLNHPLFNLNKQNIQNYNHMNNDGRNVISIISVNQSPKLYAPVPIPTTIIATTATEIMNDDHILINKQQQQQQQQPIRHYYYYNLLKDKQNVIVNCNHRYNNYNNLATSGSIIEIRNNNFNHNNKNHIAQNTMVNNNNNNDNHNNNLLQQQNTLMKYNNNNNMTNDNSHQYCHDSHCQHQHHHHHHNHNHNQHTIDESNNNNHNHKLCSIINKNVLTKTATTETMVNDREKLLNIERKSLQLKNINEHNDTDIDEDDDDCMLRDGAQALLNFASKNFLFNLIN